MPTLVELLLEPPSLPMSQFVATQIARKPSLYLSVVVPVDTGSKNKENFNFREVLGNKSQHGRVLDFQIQKGLPYLLLLGILEPILHFAIIFLFSKAQCVADHRKRFRVKF